MAPVSGLSEEERREFRRLCKRLEELRRLRRWSLRELSAFVGVPVSTLRRWLLGEKEPDSLRFEGLRSRLYRKLQRELARDRELLEELLEELEEIERKRRR
jgi:transcriptional regulator with XRE-family HTH domain